MYTDADLAVGPARVHLQDQLGVPSQAGLLHQTVVYPRGFIRQLNSAYLQLHLY